MYRTLADNLDKCQLRCSTVEGRYDALSQAHHELQEQYTKSQMEWNNKIMETLAEMKSKVFMRHTAIISE